MIVIMKSVSNVTDLPSKSIEDDSIDTIRYKAARDTKHNYLRDNYSNFSYFAMLKEITTQHHRALGFIRVDNLNGLPVGRYVTKPSLKEQGRFKMLRNRLKGRWFNG